MKLVWKDGDQLVPYTAEGEDCSYQVAPARVGMDTMWEVAKMRQPGGQIINRTRTTSLEGAFARAQTWENQQ